MPSELLWPLMLCSVNFARAELKYAALVAAWKAAPQKAKLKFIETQSDELKKLLELEG